MSKFYDKLMEEIGVGKPLRCDGIIFKRLKPRLTASELKYLADNEISY